MLSPNIYKIGSVCRKQFILRYLSFSSCSLLWLCNIPAESTQLFPFLCQDANIFFCKFFHSFFFHTSNQLQLQIQQTWVFFSSCLTALQLQQLSDQISCIFQDKEKAYHVHQSIKLTHSSVIFLDHNLHPHLVFHVDSSTVQVWTGCGIFTLIFPHFYRVGEGGWEGSV